MPANTHAKTEKSEKSSMLLLDFMDSAGKFENICHGSKIAVGLLSFKESLSYFEKNQGLWFKKR